MGTRPSLEYSGKEDWFNKDQLLLLLLLFSFFWDKRVKFCGIKSNEKKKT